MKLAARLLTIVAFFSIVLTQLAPFAFAQTANPYSSLMKTDATTPVNISTIAQGAFLGILSMATCAVGGIDFTTPNHQCLGFNTKTQTYGYAPQNTGLLGLEMQGVMLTYNNPVHTADYLNYLSSNFGLVKTAHAANNGIGFDQLSPIMSLWIAFRNLSYLLFVLVFVVIGFAVMLRAKIDPRTVMTIENQIPKLIVALVLITFSYAIAGFVIDIMWVGIYFIINIFASLDPVLAKQAGSITSSVTSNPFGFLNSFNGNVAGPVSFLGIAGQAAGGIKDITDAIVFGIFQQVGWLKVIFFSIAELPILMTCAMGAAIGSITHTALSNVPIVGFFVNIGQQGNTASGFAAGFGTCLDNAMAGMVSLVAGAVAFLVFAVALIVAIAKLWWQLVKSYALFLIFAIFGPLVIMSGVIPGSKTNFEYWIRHVLAYAIVFPTAMGVFLLGKTLMDVYAQQTVASVPPLIGIPANAYAFFGPLLGFAVIMLAPQSLTMVQDALNAHDPKYLAGIGQAIGVGAQFYGAGVGKFWQRSTREADPLKKLNEGWLRRLLLGGHNSLRRQAFEGKRMT